MNTARPRTYRNMLAALALVLYAGVANSQLQATPEDPNTPPQPSEQREATPSPVPEETPPDRSPFDYRSSEEISEDRSVSFPVDI